MVVAVMAKPIINLEKDLSRLKAIRFAIKEAMFKPGNFSIL